LHELEAIAGALEKEKAELITIDKPFYFAHHAEVMAVRSSIKSRSGDKTIRVGVKRLTSPPSTCYLRILQPSKPCGP
jgi:hypothetical protein